MSRAFSLLGDIKDVNKDLRVALADLGGANSPELKAAANTLARSWRRVLSVRGGAAIAQDIKSRRLRAIGGTPSRPGEAPRKQRGVLAKSVRHGAVGTGRRVALTWFTGPLLEEGVNTALPIRSGRRQRPGGQARRQLVILPRPSAQRALDQVKDELVDVFVYASDQRLVKL